MSEQNVVEKVPEKVIEKVPEVVQENVPEDENKFAMPSKKTPPAPTITNPEPVESEATPKVNKKLSTMSKNTKEKQKNRKLSKPTTTVSSRGKGISLDINPMYLLGIIGVIIAGFSLWYQRKSFLKEEEEEEQKDETPVQSTGGESTEKKSPPKKKKQHFDPWEWKREHQQTGVFPGNYDFD